MKREYRQKSQKANSAAGNGLVIKKHIVKSRRTSQSGVKYAGFEFVSGKIRQCTLYLGAAVKFVAYRISGEIDGSSVIARAKWERNTPPPEDFVALGRQLGVLA